MGSASRVILEGLRFAASRSRFLAVYRERGFFVLVNLLTHRKRYYLHSTDVLTLLNRGEELLAEE